MKLDLDKSDVSIAARLFLASLNIRTQDWEVYGHGKMPLRVRIFFRGPKIPLKDELGMAHVVRPLRGMPDATRPR